MAPADDFEGRPVHYYCRAFPSSPPLGPTLLPLPQRSAQNLRRPPAVVAGLGVVGDREGVAEGLKRLFELPAYGEHGAEVVPCERVVSVHRKRLAILGLGAREIALLLQRGGEHERDV